MRADLLVAHAQDMNPPTATADRVVDALIAARLVDPDTRRDSVGVVTGALGRPTLGEPGGGTDADGQASDGRGLPQVVEVVAYLGGALVLAAGGLFVAQEWGGLEFGVRVALLAVVAMVLALAGAVASRVPTGAPALHAESQDARRRLSGTLLIGASLMVALLVGMVLDHALSPAYDDLYWPGVIGALALVVAATFAYRIAPTAIGVLALISGVTTAVSTLVEANHRWEGELLGVALLLVAVVWLVLSELRWFREVTVARAVGVTIALCAAQTPVVAGGHEWLGYALTALVAVLGTLVYLRTRAWPYLAAAVLAVTLVVPEAVSDWTDDSLGAIGAVLVTGVTLLVASFAGYRLRAQPINSRDPRFP